MNQKIFDTLPQLLSRSQFMDATGLASDALTAEVAAKRIRCFRPETMKRGRRKKTKVSRCRFHKIDAAQFSGWQRN